MHVSIHFRGIGMRRRCLVFRLILYGAIISFHQTAVLKREYLAVHKTRAAESMQIQTGLN